MSASDAPSIAEKRNAEKVFSDLRRLLQLDDLWTGALSGQEELLQSDVHMILDVAGEMQEIIRRLKHSLPTVENLLTTRSASVEQGWAEANAAGFQKANKTAGLYLKQIAAAGGPVLFGAACIRTFVSGADIELDELASKLRSLTRSHKAEGDLSTAGRCALLGACIACAWLTGQVEFIPVIASGAGECIP